jgi:hypothetical protein
MKKRECTEIVSQQIFARGKMGITSSDLTSTMVVIKIDNL